MAKKIITISREFGSGGRFIGEETAKKLGIGYYDKDIIGQIAGQSGVITGVYQGKGRIIAKEKAYLHMLSQGVILPENQ